VEKALLPEANRFFEKLFSPYFVAAKFLCVCNATGLNMSRNVFAVARVSSFYFFCICACREDFENITANVLRVTKELLQKNKDKKAFRATHNKTVQQELRGQLYDPFSL